MKMAGIDVHKKVLMVVVVDTNTPEEKPVRRRFATMPSELQRFLTWLREQGVEEAVMESTAQYWRSVWLELEPHMRLHLAQAFSNRAPRGRKHDFKDAERLVRRLMADELILSFVPSGEQRIWRSMTRMKLQLTRDRVRLQNQIECLLEEMRIKLSIVVSNLLGASGLRILHALANGETDPKKLAQLGGERLQCTEEQLVDALTGRAQPVHGEMLALQLQRLQLIDQQMARLNSMIAAAMKAHQDAVIRLAEVPGLGVDSAQQIIAEVGAQASTFASAAELTSWVGTCPGKEESAERNRSSRSAKGNKYLRRGKAVTFRCYSGVCCHGWATSPPSGPSPTVSVDWFGRSCMKGCDISSKVAKLIHEPKRNGLKCWHEHFASLDIRSPSHP